jgi:MutS-like protein
VTIRSVTTPTAPISPTEKYLERLRTFDAQCRQLTNRANWIAHGRVATFLAACAGCYLWISNAAPANLWLFLALLMLPAFLGMVAWHGRLMRGASRASELAAINRHAVARLRREWEQFPVPEADLLPGSESANAEIVARDLDLFGRASMYHLLCRARTSLGRRTLAGWLVEPAATETIPQRQAAVAELAPALDLRQELEYLGLLAAKGRVDAGKFVSWAEGPSPWLGRRWPLYGARVLPAATGLLLLVGQAGYAPTSIWMVPFMLGLLLSFLFCKRIHATFNQIGSRHDEIKCYGKLLRLATQLPGKSAELQRLHQQLPSGPDSPYRRLQRLGRIIDLANFRFSPMVYLAVQPLLLWDFHVLGLVESWRRRSARQVRGWFDALAEFEALASLAALAHDQPDWSMPQITLAGGSVPPSRTAPPSRTGTEPQAAHSASAQLSARGPTPVEPTTEPLLRAERMGHPLLPDDLRVPCDVTVGPPGTFLLVTGSNMSGKSTLLRALGINVALAQAGGPACAAKMRLPPLRIATSMRIDDSLEQGISFFMAELKRLKQIVELAAQLHNAQASVPNTRTLLYLLDEILLGTNSVERHIAVQRVLARLLDQGAIGAISTHDLGLATDAALQEASCPVHYRESFHTEDGIQKMTFDYKLRPGVTSTTNALKLLEMVGLN